MKSVVMVLNSNTNVMMVILKMVMDVLQHAQLSLNISVLVVHLINLVFVRNSSLTLSNFQAKVQSILDLLSFLALVLNSYQAVSHKTNVLLASKP